MILKDIENNNKTVRRLSFIVEEKQLSHAYIFEGNEQCNKKEVADAFLKAIFCKSDALGCEECINCSKINHGNYEDIVYISKSGNSIKDEAIEALQGKLKNKPIAGDRNIAVIENADTMTARAQNRLLKTLEEPNAGTVIILLVDNAENLLQTVRSRCVVFHLNPFNSRDYSEIEEEARRLLTQALGKVPFYKLSENIRKVSAEREQAEFFLDAFEICCRDLVLEPNEEYIASERIFEAIHLVEEARNELHQGINVGYTIKKLILKLGG